MFEKRVCSFCHQEQRVAILDAETSRFIEKAEGIEDGYRLHECEPMLQAIEQAIEMLEGDGNRENHD